MGKAHGMLTRRDIIEQTRDGSIRSNWSVEPVPSWMFVWEEEEAGR